MDLLKDNIKKLYFKFLAASFGSALITSIYGVVDMAMVGQYHGPEGSAAMAVVSPIWNIIYSFGLLIGIGGGILYSIQKGRAESDEKNNRLFSSAIIFGLVISAVLMAALIVFEEPLLRLFGADDALLVLGKRYLTAVKWCVPLFVFTQIISAFLRNDNAPGLATKAVIAGGVFNIFGDWFFVFVLDMGIMGAGIATAIGVAISIAVMLTHFLSKKNTLRLVRPKTLLLDCRHIAGYGFSSFFIDIAVGVVTMLFNRMIMKYLGADTLAVYGVIVNVNIFVQCCAYGVGQAAQPIISQNYGARQRERIRGTLRYSIITVAAISAVWTVLCMLTPNGIVQLFMSPTESVLLIAPAIIRCYAVSFMMMPFNVFSTYYFQSVGQTKVSFAVSLARGLVLSGALALLLPLLFGGAALWWAIPITETAVLVFAAVMMKKTT